MRLFYFLICANWLRLDFYSLCCIRFSNYNPTVNASLGKVQEELTYKSGRSNSLQDSNPFVASDISPHRGITSPTAGMTNYFITAISSTSHSAPLGRSFTATQLLAGFEVKYFAYTSLKAPKSEML